MSGDEEKISMPLNFAKDKTQNGKRNKDSILGPSENTLAANEQLRKEYSSLATEKPKAYRITYMP
jgi:hypothetical protein